MTADERALIRAIIANPDGDLPRLVYADWLEEHGRAEQAAVLRSRHHRAGGNPANYFHFAKHYPGLWERIVYLAGATPSLLSSLPRGVVFLMAWWSSPARQAFAELAAALRVSDPAGDLLVVVLDVDGIPEEFDQLVRPHRVQLSGAGEGLWVCRGRVIGVTRNGTANNELDRYVHQLLSTCSPQEPWTVGLDGSTI